MSSSAAVPGSTSLTFSERFGAANEIADKIAKDDATLTSDTALERARLIEARIHKDSSSPEEYRKAISEFCKASPAEDRNVSIADIEDEMQLFRGSETELGDYHSCYFYQSGRSSDIFVSRGKEKVQKGLVALKVSVTSLAPHDSFREARILEKLAGGNDHIVQLLEKFRHPNTGAFIMVMPFYRHTLADYVETGFKDQKSLRRIFKQVLSAMDFMHSRNVIHRDIKSSNILLRSPSGPACLCDFGIAWTPEDHDVGEPDQRKVIEIGTTNYRPPETLFGYQSYGVEVDMWAFGCVVAEMELKSNLFDAGDLGSELALIASIFQTLGTPDENMWPEAKNCPDFGKMLFREFPSKPWTEILPNSDEKTRDFVAHLINYSQGKRMSSSEAMKHLYFDGI